jgi:repressor LexA
MSPRTELTSRQERILHFVEAFRSEHGYPPSIREIGEYFGIRSTNGVSDHLRALERKGFLQRTEHQPRSLQLVQGQATGSAHIDRRQRKLHAVPRDGASRDRTADTTAELPARRYVPDAAEQHGVARLRNADVATVRVPLLGRVAAGAPVLAFEESDQSLAIDAFLLGGPGQVFALKVIGESMIEAGIHDGDYLFVRRRDEGRAGEIVVVIIDGEATCKRFYPEGDRVRLQPENRHMAPIIVHRSEYRDVMLVGKVVGLYRVVDPYRKA